MVAAGRADEVAGEPTFGPEMVVNGDMDGATGYTFTVIDGSEPTTAGAMVFDPGSDVLVDGTLTGVPPDGTYRVSWTEGSAAAQIDFGGVGSVPSVQTTSGSGFQDVEITGATVAVLGFRNEYAGGTLDGLSLRQINP